MRACAPLTKPWPDCRTVTTLTLTSPGSGMCVLHNHELMASSQSWGPSLQNVVDKNAFRELNELADRFQCRNYFSLHVKML